MKQMKNKAFKLSALVAVLALVLAACSNGTDATDAQISDGMVRIELGLAAGQLSTNSLSPQGAPYNPANGDIGVEAVEVAVTDKDGNPVRFSLDGTGRYMADPDGSISFITLSPSDNNAVALLPQSGNDYTFTSHGWDNSGGSAEPDAELIAYAEQTQSVAVNGNVLIGLESVLGAAELNTRFPVSYATPGKLLDVMLTVTANGREDLQVPLADFDVAYTVSGPATKEPGTNRGVRLNVDPTCEAAAIEVSAEVTGLVQLADGSVETGLITAPLFTIMCPPYIPVGIEVDLEAPFINRFSYDAATGAMSIEATDNFGIYKVEIWDGPNVIASTEGPQAEISYVGNDTFTADLAPNLGGVIALVTDHSGNERYSNEAANPMFVYVDANAPGRAADGSASRPYQRLDQAQNAVAPGGTIYVLAGVYTLGSPLVLDKAGVSIIGPNDGAMPTDRRADPAVISGSIQIQAADVTISGFNFEATGTAISTTTGAWTNTYISHNLFTRENSAARAFVPGLHSTGVFYGNSVAGPDSTGVYIDDTASYRVEDNFFDSSNLVFTTDPGIDGFAYGNTMRDAAIHLGADAETVISGNEIDNGMEGHHTDTFLTREQTIDYCSDNSFGGDAPTLVWRDDGSSGPTWRVTRVDPIYLDRGWETVASCTN